jgi:hypothetical protein
MNQQDIQLLRIIGASDSLVIKDIRVAYYQEVSNLIKFRVENLRSMGLPPKEIARGSHSLRQEIKRFYFALTPIALQDKIKQRQLQVYGNEGGPSFDHLCLMTDHNYELIIEKAIKTNTIVNHQFGLSQV